MNIKDTNTAICPHCREEVNPNAVRCPHCHGKIYKWTLGRKMVVIIIVISAISVLVNLSESGNSSAVKSKTQTTEVKPKAEPVKEDRKLLSTVFAKEVIKQILKSPSTAKFVDVAAYELSSQKDVWVVNGYVDSQNGFGAMIRSVWEVQLDYRDGRGGTIKSVLFDGKKIQ